MKAWIDLELIVGNAIADGDCCFLPREGLFAYKKNIGAFTKMKYLKAKIKTILKALCKADLRSYVVAQLLDCDAVAIVSESIQENLQASDLLENTLNSIEFMLRDTRADNSVNWIIAFPENRQWLLLCHKSADSVNVFLYSNRRI